jgi:hypothetical protein
MGLARVAPTTTPDGHGAFDAGLIGARDRGTFRRSDLVGLDILDRVRKGRPDVTLRRSKTDQDGAGRKAAVSIDQSPRPKCALAG